jgi:hypothetical protein
MKKQPSFLGYILIFTCMFFAHSYFWLIFSFIMTHDPYTLGDLKKHAISSMGQSVIMTLAWYFLIRSAIKNRKKLEEKEINEDGV